MSCYHLTEQARQDLDDLWFSMAEANPNATNSFLDILYEKFVLAAG